MASIKALLKANKKTTAGLFPLYLRVTMDRKTKFISLGIKLEKSQWDEANQRVKKSYPNSARANALISKKKAEVEGETLEMDLEGKVMNQNSFLVAKGKSKYDFFQYANDYLKRIESKGKVGTYKRVKYTLEKLKTYHNHENLPFKEITVSYLKNYEQYLADILYNKPNTIHSNFKIVRTILNCAVNEDLMLRDKNPFYKFKIKSVPTTRAYLTEKEIEAMDNLKLEKGSNLFDHRNMYVFATYVGGLRISDMLNLKWNNFDGINITVATLKTGATVSIKVPKKGLEILQLYTNKDNKPEQFIFPVLKADYDKFTPNAKHLAIGSSTALINKNLKTIAKKAKIDKSISFHTSRHTFGTRALRKGMRIEYVSKLMGHSTIKETQNYAKIVNEELDKAMDIFDE